MRKRSTHLLDVSVTVVNRRDTSIGVAEDAFDELLAAHTQLLSNPLSASTFRRASTVLLRQC